METVNKEKMESLRLLAETTIKISEAKNTLQELKSKQEEYLTLREDMAQKHIQKILEESKELLENTHSNYTKVNVFCREVMSYADGLSEMQVGVQNLLETFKNKAIQWEKNAELQTIELSHQKKLVEQDKENLKEWEKRIEKDKKNIEKEKALIESRQKALETSYKLEKDLWNKLTA